MDLNVGMCPGNFSMPTPECKLGRNKVPSMENSLDAARLKFHRYSIKPWPRQRQLGIKRRQRDRTFTTRSFSSQSHPSYIGQTKVEIVCVGATGNDIPRDRCGLSPASDVYTFCFAQSRTMLFQGFTQIRRFRFVLTTAVVVPCSY